MPATPDQLDQLNEAIAALVRVRDALAADLPAVGPNGSGESTLARLRASAVELGARITGDDRVSETTAARLIGVEGETLARMRAEGRAPPNYRMPCGGSRISYRLADLSFWVEARREDF